MSIVPPQSQPGGPPGAEQDILAVLSEPEFKDLLPEVLAELQPDEVANLENIPLPQRNQLLKDAIRRVQMRAQAEEAGGPPPGALAPPNGPPQGMAPPGMPVGGPLPSGVSGGIPGGVGGAPPPSSPPLPDAGPPVQPGGPAPLPDPKQEDYLKDVDEEEKDPEPPDDWEPESLTDLHGKGYAWRDKPEHGEVCQLAQETLDDTFWQERNQACFDQSWSYYRSRLWAKHNGLPFSFVQGDLVYMLSTPAKQVDRIVARCQPHAENLTFSLPARAEMEEYTDSAQFVENFGRDLWRKACKQWWDALSQTRLGASLERTLTHLDTLHGAVGFSIRPDMKRRKGTKRDINAHQPIVIDIIPQHEIYMTGDLTMRIQSVTLKEARRLSKVVRDRWPSRPKDERASNSAEWCPPDDHPSRLISGSDIYGKWYWQCFDICVPDGKALKADEEGQHWTVPPEQIDFGFCLFQLPPGWQTTGDNALPDDRQPAENYGRNFARGVLFANLEDFYHQDQAASAAISAFRYNRNPAAVDYIDYKLRQEANQPLPDKARLGEGGRNERAITERTEFVPKNFADTPSDNFAISMMFSQTADTFPAALGGGGAAQSGYDRRQMVENAQLLHVEEIRKHVAGIVEHIIRLSLTLVYRYGSGKKPKFSELPFRLSSGGVGEARLTMRDIERAGIDVEVNYYEEDIEAELRKNNIYLPRLQAGTLSKESAMEEFGTDDIEREQERIDTEFALTHPSMQMAKAMLALSKRVHPLLPFLREAAAMEAMAGGGQGGPPGMPGQPGMPSIAGGPPGGLETVSRGMPPDMKMPQGM